MKVSYPPSELSQPTTYVISGLWRGSNQRPSGRWSEVLTTEPQHREKNKGDKTQIELNL